MCVVYIFATLMYYLRFIFSTSDDLRSLNPCALHEKGLHRVKSKATNFVTLETHICLIKSHYMFVKLFKKLIILTQEVETRKFKKNYFLFRENFLILFLCILNVKYFI